MRTENMLLSQPDCGEHALGLVEILVRSGSVDVVVVDSVDTYSFLSFPFLSCCVLLGSGCRYIMSQFWRCNL